jgi:parallel beta-helix repeat protein
MKKFLALALAGTLVLPSLQAGTVYAAGTSLDSVASATSDENIDTSEDSNKLNESDSGSLDDVSNEITDSDDNTAESVDETDTTTNDASNEGSESGSSDSDNSGDASSNDSVITEDDATSDSSTEDSSDDNSDTASSAETSSDAASSASYDDASNSASSGSSAITKTDEDLISDAFEYSETIDNFDISIKAPENVLPNGVTVEIKKVDTHNGSDIKDVVNDIANEDSKSVFDHASFDISFYLDGEEVEPVNDSVNVSIKVSDDFAIENQEFATDIEVYHLSDDEISSVDSDIDVKEDEIEIEETEIIDPLYDSNVDTTDMLAATLPTDSDNVSADGNLEDTIDEDLENATFDTDDSTNEELDPSIFDDIDMESCNSYEEITTTTYYDSYEVSFDADSFSTYSVALTYLNTNWTTSGSEQKVSFSSSELEGENFYSEIQKALNSAISDDSSTVYHIVVPAGSYTLSTGKGFKISSNTILEFNSNTNVTLKATTSSKAYIAKLYDGESHTGYDGFTNIQILNGNFTTSGSKTTGVLMQLTHCNNVTVSGMTINNTLTEHSIEMAAAKDITISGCIFTGSTSYGREAVEIDFTHSSDNINITDADSDSYDDLTVESLTISNCTFNNMVRGIGNHIYVLGSHPNNINILDNKFTNITERAIFALGWTNSLISANTMTNVYTGVDFESAGGYMYERNDGSYDSSYINYSSGNVVENNTISLVNHSDYDGGTPSFAIRIGGLSNDSNLNTGAFYVDGFTVNGNTITGEAVYPIYAMYTNSSSIINNIIKNNTSAFEPQGITLDHASSCSVTGNTISNFTTSNAIGIVCKDSSNSNKISSNTLTSINLYGIYLYESSATNIDSNTFNNPGEEAIYLNVSNADSISSNLISGGKYGIMVNTSSTVSKLYTNNMANITNNGVLVYNSSQITTTKNNNVVSKKKAFIIDSSSKGIAFSCGAIVMGNNEKCTAKMFKSKSGAKVKKKNSKKSVVTWSSNKLTAKKNGSSTLKFKQDGCTAILTVKVKKPATKVKTSKKTITLSIGDVYKIPVKLTGGSGKITYKSSKKKYASVSSNGIVVAKKAGTTKITIKTYNGKTYKLKIKVKS